MGGPNNGFQVGNIVIPNGVVNKYRHMLENDLTLLGVNLGPDEEARGIKTVVTGDSVTIEVDWKNADDVMLYYNDLPELADVHYKLTPYQARIPWLHYSSAGILVEATYIKEQKLGGAQILLGCQPVPSYSKVIDSYWVDVRAWPEEDTYDVSNDASDSAQGETDVDANANVDVDAKPTDDAAQEVGEIDGGVDAAKPNEGVKPETDAPPEFDSIFNYPIKNLVFENPTNKPKDESTCQFDTKPTKWTIEHLVKGGQDVYPGEIAPNTFLDNPEDITGMYLTNNLGLMIACDLTYENKYGIKRWVVSGAEYYDIYSGGGFMQIIATSVDTGEGATIQLKGEWGAGETTCSSTFEMHVGGNQ